MDGQEALSPLRATTPHDADEQSLRRTELLRGPSPIAGWELVQALVEIPVGGASGRQRHPGPEVGYVVRGEVAMHFDDRPPMPLRTGEPFLIPSGVVHDARNVGQETTRVLSTYLVDETQPLATAYP